MAAVRVTVPVAPAARRAGLAKVSLPFAAVATTSRLSWKAASVTTVLVTSKPAVPATRTLPRVRLVAPRVAEARS